MRSILLHGAFNANELWWALGLNTIYLLVGYLAFRWFLQRARINGSLLQLGE
jgi:ABC-2 type transport system permease protein